MNILCLFVNYNNSAFTIKCCDSIFEHSGDVEVNIIVVDNNSNEKNKEDLKKYEAGHRMNVLFLQDNIGYFPALNMGYQSNPDLIRHSDFIVIGNNDLIFNSPFFNLLQSRQYEDDVFVVCPDIVNLDNNHQNPQVAIKYSKWQLLFLELYHWSYFMAVFMDMVSNIIKIRGKQKSRKDHETSRYISIGYGACYILTRQYITEVGEIPSYLFLMNEENALSDIVFKHNGRLYYDAELSVDHQEHSSVGLAQKRKLYSICQQSYRISKQHFNNKYLFDKQLI